MAVQSTGKKILNRFRPVGESGNHGKEKELTVTYRSVPLFVQQRELNVKVWPSKIFIRIYILQYDVTNKIKKKP